MAAFQNRLTNVLLVMVLFALLAVIGMLASDARGGPLDPPNAPGSTDGVLLPGTPITALPITITQPGNYYLTRNLTIASATVGIQINANDVTLDLNGFTLDGNNTGTSAVYTSSTATGLTVRNGSATRWTDDGFRLEDLISVNLENLHAHHNGGDGISISGGTLTNCTSRSNTGDGVRALFAAVSDCSVGQNNRGFFVFSSTLRSSVAGGNAVGIESAASVVESSLVTFSSGFGILAREGSQVRGNTVLYSGGSGIQLAGTEGETLVIENTVSYSGGTGDSSGIYVANFGNRVSRNNTTGNSGRGITVEGSYNTIDENSALSNAGTGLVVNGTKNTVVRNSAVDNGTPIDNYAIGVGNNPGNEIAAATGNDWSNTQ